ncbi:MAG: hypothetical protein WCO28_00570 [Bacteroidota bacterium]
MNNDFYFSIKSLFLILFLLTIYNSNAQVKDVPFETEGVRQDPDWVSTAITKYTDFVGDLKADKDGNIYTTGRIESYLVFQNKKSFPLPEKNKNVSQNESHLYFLCKQNNKGKLEWFRHSKSDARGIAIKTDNEGNIFVLGKANKKVQFQSGDSSFLWCGNDSSYNFTFINKYDMNGKLVFTKYLNIKENFTPSAFIIDKKGNYVIAGEYDFRRKNKLYEGRHSFMIIKTDASLNPLWKFSGGEINDSHLNSICEDSKGNIYTGGYFKDSTLVNNIYRKANSNYEAFIFKLNSKGKFEWIRTNSTGANEFGKASVQNIFCTTSDEIYLCGKFTHRFYLSDQKVSQKDITTINGTEESFFSLLDKDGNLKWVNTSHGKGLSAYDNSAIDQNDNLIITGIATYSSFTTLGKELFSFVSKGKRNVFFLSYNNKGEQQWLKAYENADGSQYQKICTNKNNIYLFGNFSSKLSFVDSVYSAQSPSSYYWVCFDKTKFSNKGIRLEAKPTTLIERVGCRCYGKETTKIGYAQSVSSLLTNGNFERFTGWKFADPYSSFNKTFFKDLQFSGSTTGDAKFYSLTTISQNPIRFLNFDKSLLFNFTPCNSDQYQLPLTVNINQSILHYQRDFDYDTFKQTTEEYFDVLKYISGMNNKDILNYLFYENENINVKNKINSINKLYKVKISFSDIPDKFINNFIDSLEKKKINIDNVILDNFIKTNSTKHFVNEEESAVLEEIFENKMAQFTIKDIIDLLYPQFDINFGTEYLGVEFGSNLLRKWDNVNQKPFKDTNDKDLQFSILLNVKNFEIDSKRGLKAEIISTCFPKAEINGTGILMDCNSIEFTGDTIFDKTRNMPFSSCYQALNSYRQNEISNSLLHNFMGIGIKTCNFNFPVNKENVKCKGENILLNRKCIYGKMIFTNENNNDSLILIKTIENNQTSMTKTEFENLINNSGLNIIKIEYFKEMISVEFYFKSK